MGGEAAVDGFLTNRLDTRRRRYTSRLSMVFVHGSSSAARILDGQLICAAIYTQLTFST
jgi:hypothetical protein